MPLGALLAGVGVETWGLLPCLIVAAALYAVATLSTVFVRDWRRLDDPRAGGHATRSRTARECTGRVVHDRPRRRSREPRARHPAGMPSLPTVLSPAELPLAELSALRLDGDVYALGGRLLHPRRARESGAPGSRRARVAFGTAHRGARHGGLDLGRLAHHAPAARAVRRSRAAIPTRRARRSRGAGGAVRPLGCRVARRSARHHPAAHGRRSGAVPARVHRRRTRRWCASSRKLGDFTLDDCIELMDRRPNLLEKRRARTRLDGGAQPELTR